jgi:hypothetical protein
MRGAVHQNWNRLELSVRALIVATALAGIPLFIGLVATSGVIHWILIGVGFAIMLMLIGIAVRSDEGGA